MSVMTDTGTLARQILSGDIPVQDALKLLASEHDDERKALEQLVHAMAAYPTATGLARATEFVIRDAERWRAFISSERFRMLGTGGKGAGMHIGLELWGEYRLPASSRVSHGAAKKLTADAVKTLTKYVDDRRKEGCC